MPRKRTPARQPDPPADPAPAADQVETDQDELEASDEIDRLVAQLPPGAGYTVTVFKRSADGSRIDRCRKFPADQLDMDTLPKIFGGGQFTLGICDQAGKRLLTRHISFDPTLYPPPVADAPAGAPGAPDQVRDLVDRFTRTLSDERANSSRMIEALINATIGRPATPAAAPTSMRERLEELNLIINMAKGAGGTPASEMAQAFRDGAAAVRSVASAATGDEEAGEGGGDVTMRVIEKFINRLMAQPIPPATGAPAPALPAGNGQPETTTPDPDLPADLQQFTFLKKYAATLIGWASTGFDPGRVAGVIYNLVNDAYIPMLQKVIAMSSSERHAILTQLDSRLAPYAAYIDTVAEELAAAYAEDQTDSAEEDDHATDQPGS